MVFQQLTKGFVGNLMGDSAVKPQTREKETCTFICTFKSECGTFVLHFFVLSRELCKFAVYDKLFVQSKTDSPDWSW